MITGKNYKLVYEAIFDALCAEIKRREGKSVEAWIRAERACVLHEVNHWRALLSYAPLDISVVERAERLAVGHSDYVSKYACAAADLVFRKEVA